jgi:hypothetical protein
MLEQFSLDIEDAEFQFSNMTRQLRFGISGRDVSSALAEATP